MWWECVVVVKSIRNSVMEKSQKYFGQRANLPNLSVLVWIIIGYIKFCTLFFFLQSLCAVCCLCEQISFSEVQATEGLGHATDVPEHNMALLLCYAMLCYIALHYITLHLFPWKTILIVI